MIPQHYAELLAMLKARTEAGSLAWEATTDEAEYVVRLGKHFVAIRHGVDEDDDFYARLVLRDAEGHEIDSFFAFDPGPDYSLMKELFDSARRIALKVDQALKDIMGELRRGPGGPGTK